jgi:putative peptidoglycan lipid II flippase
MDDGSRTEVRMEEVRTERPEPGTRRSTVSTIVVMACTALSRLFGFLKQALIGAFFGASGYADALNAVFNIPNNLRKLFAEGAFSSAFIPVLSSTIAEDRTGRESRALVKNLFGLQLVILVPLVALGLAFPRFFIQVLLPFADPSKIPVAAELFRWMFNYILFVSLSAVIMAVLNSHGRFAVPALSPLLFSAAIVAAIILLGRSMGVASMGIGVLVGGVLQLGFQIPAFRKQGYGVSLDLRFSNPRFLQMVKLWVPYLASASIFTINQFVANFFASGLEDGSVSALANAIMFLQIPIGIFTASVTTVVFPQMSRQAAVKDSEGLRASMGYGIQFLTVLLVPSAVVLCLFGREIISVCLQRMSFKADNTLMASRVLTGYAVGLLSMGLYNFIQRFFYSLKEFRAPIVSALVIAVVDILLSLLLKETRLRVTGLAVANSAAFTAGLVYLLVVARRRLTTIGGRRMLVTLVKAAAASVPVAALLVGFRYFKPEMWIQGSRISSILWVAAAVGICIIMALAALAGLRVPFVMDILRRGRRKA